MPGSDWANQAYNQTRYTSAEVTQVSKQIADALQIGGKKNKPQPKLKATTKRVLVNNKVRKVYEGQKGGQYIKYDGEIVSMKKLVKEQ
jgi:hypothetical protein